MGVGRRGRAVTTNLGLSLADTIPLVPKDRSPIVPPNRKRRYNKPTKKTVNVEETCKMQEKLKQQSGGRGRRSKVTQATVGSKTLVPANPSFIRNQGQHLPQHRKRSTVVQKDLLPLWSPKGPEQGWEDARLTAAYSAPTGT